MDAIKLIKVKISEALLKCDISLDPNKLEIKINKTNNIGDYTFPVFTYAKEINDKHSSKFHSAFEEFGLELKMNPEQLAIYIVNCINQEENAVEKCYPINGFVNLVMHNSYWQFSLYALLISELESRTINNKKIFVEYSSPNTNKPLHLGHVRNILIGWSISKILERVGYKVIRTQVINDRGIAICKSMVAWEVFGNEKTPESVGVKGDHFVGDYYVKFESEFKLEYKAWQDSTEGKKIFEISRKEGETEADFFAKYKNNYFNEISKLGRMAKDCLIKWENHDPDTLALWNKMNGWVLKGYDTTYESLGVSFDINYYESQTYTLGRDIIKEAIKKGIFYQKDDSSVWINLEDVGLDQKLVLRSDGTSVYITQDIGMAQKRYEEYKFDKCIYVVADEQDYHFKVLFETIKKLGEPYANDLHHLSYGMVELPSGKMKSREGTVVDADDLIVEVINEARNNSAERGELSELSKPEQDKIIRKIGMAALKYHIIKVHPKKRMIFDPKESVDLQGHTGPYIQNAYVRIKSIYRKLDTEDLSKMKFDNYIVNAEEKELLIQLIDYNNVIDSAANSYDPSLIANFLYNLAKAFHRFYHDHSILNADSESARNFRILISKKVGNTLEDGMNLLGIEMPEQM